MSNTRYGPAVNLSCFGCRYRTYEDHGDEELLGLCSEPSLVEECGVPQATGGFKDQTPDFCPFIVRGETTQR